MFDRRTLTPTFNTSNNYFKPLQLTKKKLVSRNSVNLTNSSSKQNKQKDRQKEKERQKQKQVQKIFLLSHQNPFISFPSIQLKTKQIVIELIQDGRQTPCKIKLTHNHIEIQRQNIQHSFPLNIEQNKILKLMVSDYSSLQFRIVISIHKGKIRKSVVNSQSGLFYQINPFELIEEANRLRKIKIDNFKQPKPTVKRSFNFSLTFNLKCLQNDVSIDKISATERFQKMFKSKTIPLKQNQKQKQKVKEPQKQKSRIKQCSQTTTHSSKQLKPKFKSRLSSQTTKTPRLSIPFLNQ